MSMAKKPAAIHRADGQGGGFVLLPYSLLNSAAYRSSSARAKAVLVVIASRFKGYNNGRLCLSSAELAEALNCWNYAANAKAIGELIARGIVVLEKSYRRGVRLSPEYRLTFVSSGPEDDVKPATNEYLRWKEGDAGTVSKRAVGKKTVAAIANETCISSVTIANERKRTVATTEDETSPINGKPPFSKGSSFAVIAEHIVSHGKGGFSDHSDTLKIAGGPRCTSSGVVSAAPSAEELRDRALALIGRLGRGAQGRLAREAKIPGGTLSKFLNSNGPLSEHARVRLTCAFPKTETAARKNGRAAH
jgi:hypothetical protein